MVSVIIPTYNQSGSLLNAINSVLTQTYKDVEVIVVDDNNPDTPARNTTEEMMKQFDTSQMVYYIKHEKNKNGSAARNTGFRASKGDFVAFLDDDDVWDSLKLEKQVNYLQMHPEFDAVYCYTRIGNGSKNPNKFIEGDIVIPYLTNYVSLQTSCILLRRESVTELHGFDESFRRHQDYEFMIRFFFAGFKIGCVPEYLSQKGAGGLNAVSGAKLDELKEKFLSTFDSQFEELDRRKPGVKKKIIVANYVKNFESHLASKNFRLAFRIFRKYFFIAPLFFIEQCILLFNNHRKRAGSK